MQGALYFPKIGLPPSAWLTNSLLYWDIVGTITPHEYALEPDEFDSFTRELVEQELVYMAFPEYTNAVDFDPWLSSLEHAEVAVRRDRLAAGGFTPIHRDKFLDAIVVPAIGVDKPMAGAGTPTNNPSDSGTPRPTRLSARATQADST